MMLAVALALLLAGGAAPGRAHTARLSASEVAVEAATARLRMRVNASDLEAALGLELGAEAGVDPALVATNAAAIAGYLVGRARVATREGIACEAEPGTPQGADEHVTLAVIWRCPAVHGGLLYRVTLFHELDARARHMVIFPDQAGRLALLGAGAPETEISGALVSLGRVLWSYLAAGIEHIAIGYDHIAFVIGVILWGRRPWSLVKVVTAFTLAHSVTLSLAVLDVVSLPSRWVEALIALSVIYVAAENFFVRDIERRWRLTFLFGLVHGFGFAGALRQFGLPREALVPALAAFNVGVELGQLAIVAVALAILLVLDRVTAVEGGGRDPRVVRVASGVILMLGLYWLARRTVLA